MISELSFDRGEESTPFIFVGIHVYRKVILRKWQMEKSYSEWLVNLGNVCDASGDLNFSPLFFLFNHNLVLEVGISTVEDDLGN